MKKTLFWLPRILSILLCLFIFSFSLDVFEEGISLQDALIGLFMHNIPNFVVIFMTFLGFKNALYGALGFGILSIFLMGIVIQNMGIGNPAFLIFGIPSLVIAGLYAYQVHQEKKVN